MSMMSICNNGTSKNGRADSSLVGGGCSKGGEVGSGESRSRDFSLANLIARDIGWMHDSGSTRGSSVAPLKFVADCTSLSLFVASNKSNTVAHDEALLLKLL